VTIRAVLYDAKGHDREVDPAADQPRLSGARRPNLLVTQGRVSRSSRYPTGMVFGPKTANRAGWRVDPRVTAAFDT